MTTATGLTKFDISMVEIADLSNGRVTDLADQANFTGGHAHLRKIAFLGEQLRRATRRADHLATTSLTDLDVVDQRTNGDVGDWKRITGTDLGSRASHDGVADFEIDRCNDVALFAIGVVQKRQ